MTGGFAAALLAFLVAAVVIVVLLFAAAASVASAQERTVQRLEASAPAIKRWGGAVLIVVGVWFILLAVFADVFARVFPV